MLANPWLETLGVILLGVVGVRLGRWCSRLPKPWWTLGYFLPLLFIGLIGLARRFTVLEFTPPISWLMAGRTEFALSALIGTMVLTTPLSRLAHLRDKVFVCVMMVLVTITAAVLPFLAPAFNRSHLAALKTKIDPMGVCLQSNDYNCGPAAAVTALRRLGLPAEEGEIAILAHTSQWMGTPADMLRDALNERYATNGVSCEHRHFKSLAELDAKVFLIAQMKFGFLVDHYVTVLEVTRDEVIVGDPLSGIVHLSHQEFNERWRFSGVVVRRRM